MESYRSLWDVAVLALLRESPMHPYQMQRLLRDRHKDELLVLKRGSLYHSINRLLSDSLIEAVSSGREGRRPERTTYRITPQGKSEFMRVLRHMVEVPRHESSDFMAALSFLVFLNPRDAIAQLEARAKRIEEETASIASGLHTASAWVERINLIESEYLLAMRRAELAWVRGLVDDIRSGSLGWDLKEVLTKARQERTAALSPQEK